MKRLLLIIVCLSFGISLWADKVTADQARQKAAQFLNGKRPAGSRASTRTSVGQMNMVSIGRNDSYYIFNATDGGFVIVSGEDATEEILGYSETGSINPEIMPCGMRALLDNYSKQIECIKENGLSTSTTMLRKARHAFHLDPSQLARFGQESPYYDKCPTYWTGDAFSLWDPFSTGCAATAMAQLMYAYKWPHAILNTIQPYTSLTRKKDVPGFESGTAINWSNIEQRYNDGREINKIQKEEIANLMLMAGSSVRMDYGNNRTESEASIISVVYALKQFFGYSPSLSFIRLGYINNSEEWTDIICKEIQKGYPIMYRAKSEEGGSHFFLLEGYDENEYFDINFGWEGHKNVSENKNICKCLLFVKPGLEKDLIKYHIAQDAIINVEPRTDNATPNIPMYLWPFNWSGPDGKVYWRSEDDQRFHNMELSWEVYNNMPIDGAVFDHGVVFTKNGIQQGDVVGTGSIVSSYKRDGETFTVRFSCGENLPDGFYKIHFVSRVNSTSEWVHADNFNNIYLNALVCRNALTIMTKNDADYKIKVDDIDVTTQGQLRVGKPSDINVTVKSTSGKYDGAIILNIAWTDANGVKQDCPIDIAEAHLEENQSMSISHSWIPSQSGELKVEIIDKRWKTVGSTTINVFDANAMQDMLEVTGLTLIDGDIESQTLDGTSVRGEISLKNNDDITKKANVSIGLTDQETQEDVYKSISVNIAPGSTATYDFKFASLIEGHHYVISALYASGEEFYRSSELLCTTASMGEVEAGNDELVAYEYWFDDNLAGKKTVSLNSNSAIIRADIDTRNLSVGPHRFNFRLKRSDGMYSSVSSSLFMNLKTEKGGWVEYWFDDDIENSATMPLANTESEQEVALNMSDPDKFPLGFHRLNMRVATKGKSLSHIYTSHVLKVPSGQIDMIEYWVDDDYASSRTVEGHVASNDNKAYVFVNPFDLSGVPSGPHRIYYRPASKNGKACGAVSMASVIVGGGTPSKIEYWFDGDVTKSATIDLPASALTDTVDVALLMNNNEKFPLGLHQLSMRLISKDREQSPIYSARVLKVPSGEIDMIEYWVDDDYEHPKTVEGHVASYDENMYIFVNPFDLSGVPSGPHRIYYRPASKNGKACGAVSMASVIVGGGTPSKIEYWFDGDVTKSATIDLPASAMTDTVDVALLMNNSEKFPLGMHQLSMRLISNDREQSPIYSARVLKMASGKMDVIEYWVEDWVDEDGIAHPKSITGKTASSDENAFVFNNTFDLSDASEGYHRVYYRATSGNGNANSAVSMTPVMVKSRYEQNYLDAKILGYSISVDNQIPQIREFTNPKSEIVMSHTLDARNLSSGNHMVKAKFWNSAYAGVSVEQQFNVVIPEQPTLTLSAEEKDGLVRLQFQPVPNNLRYRIIRTDANGAKAKVDSKEGSCDLTTVTFTDNPAAGNYTYYVQSAYSDYNGEQHSITSNEVTVTVEKPQTEVVAATQFGYIAGSISYDKKTPIVSARVKFSDGIVVNAPLARFLRTRIPVGTELTMTVEGDDTHEYTAKTITVKAGLNQVTINGTLREEYMPNNLENDLGINSAVELTMEDGLYYAKFSVKNLSHNNDWKGIVRVKVFNKEKADNMDVGLDEMGYKTKNLYIGDVYIDKIGYNDIHDLKVHLKGLKPKKDTEFYLYFESEGKWIGSQYPEEKKPIGTNSNCDMAENPVVRTIGKTGGENPQWDDEARERFASTIVGVSSLIKGVDGNVGDLSPYHAKALNAAKKITGETRDDMAIQKFFEWMAGKSAWEVINEPNLISVSSIVYDVYSNMKSYGNGTMVQKYWNDILGASYDYGSAQLVISDLALVAHATISKDPVEATVASASVIYSLVYPVTSSGAVPYAAMMYSYTVIGRALVNKILEYKDIIYDAWLADRLLANKPFTGDKTGENANRQNTAIDIKLVVKTGKKAKTAIDFTQEAAQRQVGDIILRAHNNPAYDNASFHFTPVYMKDGIMLRCNGSKNEAGISYKGMNLDEFSLEINWGNGRQTIIPLNEACDGIDIDLGNAPHTDDTFEKYKPSIYTITLTTTTGKDHMAEEFYLGNNKDRK